MKNSSYTGYVYLFPDECKAIATSIKHQNYNEKLFLLNNALQTYNINYQLSNLLFEFGVDEIYDIDAKGSIPISVEDSNDNWINRICFFQLTKNLQLFKRSSNFELLSRIRQEKCLVLAKINEGRVQLYEEDNSVIAFSSSIILYNFLIAKGEVLQDGYEPIIIKVMDIDYYIMDLANKSIWFNPIKSYGVNLALKINADLYYKLMGTTT